MNRTLVLASTSPRRRALLQAMHLQFEVCGATGDGPVRCADPPLRAQGHAEFKAHQVAAQVPDSWILAADTVVVAAGEVLEKPKNREDAERMLRLLQACKSHEVWTGCCLCAPSGQVWSRSDCSKVLFRSIPEADLSQYLCGKEWRDKAGAYALQGWAGAYACCVEGEPDTVIGLAAFAVKALFLAAMLPPSAFLG